MLSDERTFHLSATQSVVTLADRKEAVDPELIEVQPDDIYVASSLVVGWLPVDLEIDLPGLSLRVNAREPLPVLHKRNFFAAGEVQRHASVPSFSARVSAFICASERGRSGTPYVADRSRAAQSSGGIAGLK